MIGIDHLIKVVSLCLCLGVMGYDLPALKTTPPAQYPPGRWDTIIEDQVFTETLHLDEGDDNTLIINATFQDIDGSGIMIRNVSNVYIKNCTVHDVTEDGIVLRSTGSTHNVTIDGCTIYNTGFNGILAKQNEEEKVDHSNLVIKNNTLHDIGTTEYDHGLYIFSTDSLIENNVVAGTTGNGISLRSSAIVRGNKVSDTQGSCIKYYSNHAAGASNALYIENNVCHLVDEGDGDPGISLRRAIEASEDWLVEDYYIRFNTVVLRTADRYGIEVESAAFDARRVELYGNLVINTEDEAKTINPQYVDYLSSNYTSTSLAGLIISNKSPYDFQLKANSPARYYASTEPRFPATDINGAMRTASYLDAGAYQFSSPPPEKTVAESRDRVLMATPNQLSKNLAKPVLVETPGQPSENLTKPVTNSQDRSSVENLDKPFLFQSGGLISKLAWFIFLVGLLLIIGIIIRRF